MRRSAGPPENGNGGDCAPAIPQFKTNQQQQPNNTAAFRTQRLVEHLHELGPRAVHELLIEIATAHGIGEDIGRRLEQYGRIDVGLLRALGGDRFASMPVHAVTQ